LEGDYVYPLLTTEVFPGVNEVRAESKKRSAGAKAWLKLL